MADIAKMAGVSISTVSRALAGNPLIPKPLRDQIVQLAQTHGYVVNQSARSLRLRKTDTIGLIIPLAHETGQLISDPFFLEMVGRLADEITRRNYSVLLHKVSVTQAGWLERIIQSHRADGFVFIGQSDQHEALNAVAANYKPLVVWGAHLEGQKYCAVGSDNVAGGRMAVAHLAAAGRKRIAFFGATAAPEAAQRFEGYRRGLAEAGLPFDPALVAPTPYTMEEARQAITAFLRTNVPFDAAFTFSDVIALAAIASLTEAGKRTPTDVAVVGFDDIILARHSAPPLTTVRQDLALGAKAMVDLLFARMDGKDVSSILAPVELIVRGSSV